MKKKKFDKSIFKKTPEELEAFLAFKRKGSVIESKKGKGSYSRKKKHKNGVFDEMV